MKVILNALLLLASLAIIGISLASISRGFFGGLNPSIVTKPDVR